MTKDCLVVRSEGQRKVRREVRHYNQDANDGAATD